MASILNLPNCGGSTGTFNSGKLLCDVIRDIPYMLLLMDAGVEFDDTDMASVTSFVAALDTATRAARGSRVFPIKDLTNFEDVSTEPTNGAVGNLVTAEIELVDAVPAFNFQHRNGDLYHKLLAKAERENLVLMIVDKKYRVYGTVTSSGKLTGFSLAQFKAQLPKFATPDAVANYPFKVTLGSVTEYKENLGIVETDSTIVNISGNIDVTLSVFNHTTNVVKVKLLANGGKNLFDLYATELAAVGAWVAKNKQTGASFTLTSAAATDTANKVFTLTLDSTAYTALSSGDEVTIDLASASVLSGLAVDGYESTGLVTIEKA